METGTGKTYTFLRTVYERNYIYGFKKFVIVVPCVAIREGSIKNLQITHEHFQRIYGNPPINFLMNRLLGWYLHMNFKKLRFQLVEAYNSKHDNNF